MANAGNGSGGDGAGAGRNRPGEPLGANSEIGRKLKQYFDGVISEGVPDRFSQLLSQLELADPGAAPRGKE